MNYKKKSIYCTEKIKTVTTTQTTINIVQNINNNKNTATVISKPNKNTSNVKKQIPLSSYARSKVGSSIANAFDTLDFKIYIDPSVNYSGYYSTKDQSITLRKNDNVLYHELGHFVSFISGCSCSSAEFKDIYNKEKANTQNIIKRMYAIVQMSSMQNVITCIYLINHG